MSKAEIINYWTWKDSEVVAELGRYGIELPEYDRKMAISALKKAVKMAHAKEMMEEQFDDDDEDGSIKPAVAEQLRIEAEVAVLMVSRVIFHNIGETDLPYVPIGHNGRAFYVPKEIEVDVPDYLLDSVIHDAVEHRMFPQVLQNGQIQWITRKVQRFPYSIIRKSFPAGE